MQQWWNDSDSGKRKYLQNNLLQRHFVHRKFLHGLARDRTKDPTVKGTLKVTGDKSKYNGCSNSSCSNRDGDKNN
jgi:hypothetical protein